MLGSPGVALGTDPFFWKFFSGPSWYKGVAKSSSCVGHLRSHQFGIGGRASFLPVAPYVQRLDLHRSIKAEPLSRKGAECILFSCRYSNSRALLVHNSWIPSRSVELCFSQFAMLSVESVRSQFCYPSIGGAQNTGLSVPIDFPTTRDRHQLTWVWKQHNGRQRLSQRY